MTFNGPFVDYIWRATRRPFYSGWPCWEQLPTGQWQRSYRSNHHSPCPLSPSNTPYKGAGYRTNWSGYSPLPPLPPSIFFFSLHLLLIRVWGLRLDICSLYFLLECYIYCMVHVYDYITTPYLITSSLFHKKVLKLEGGLFHAEFCQSYLN